MSDLIFIDTETTGLDRDECEILDVHAILIDADFNVVAEAGGRVLPTRPDDVSPEAAAVNGYDRETWEATARPLEDVLPGVLALAGRAEEWWGSNPGFDVGFIARACERLGLAMPKGLKLVDTGALARQHGVRGRVGLDVLCATMGIVMDGAHTARGDCLRTIEVAKRLTALDGRPKP